MPDLIYPSARFWTGHFAPKPGQIIYDDPAQERIGFIDFDGVWFSEDPRILSFCGIGRPGPEAIIWKCPLSPKDNMQDMVDKFVLAHGLSKQDSKEPSRDDSQNLTDQERVQLLHGNVYLPYLRELQTTLQGLGLQEINKPSAFARALTIQTVAMDSNIFPHIDNDEDRGLSKWTVFCTVGGGPGSIIHTKNQRHIQSSAGEIAAWREGGHDGTFHSGPEHRHRRLKYRETFQPNRPLPSATCHIELMQKIKIV